MLFCVLTLVGCWAPVPKILPPAPIAIYFGLPSQVNDAQGDLDVAIAEFAHFKLVVLGKELEHATHEEHSYTQAIIRQLSVAGVEVYGYIDMGVSTQNLSLFTAQQYVDEWKSMGAVGIFWDNAGYNFGVDRARQTSLIHYTHRQGLTVFVNTWEPLDIFADNHGLTSPLVAGDWYLAQNQLMGDGEFGDLSDWWEKSQQLDAYRKQTGVRIAALTTGDDSPIGWANSSAYRQALWAAYLFGWEGFGFTNPQYSANGVGINRLRLPPHIFTNPGTLFISPPIQVDAQTYLRVTDAGTIHIFGSKISDINTNATLLGGGGTFQGGVCNTAALDIATQGGVIWPNCSTSPPVHSSPYGARQKASEGFRYDWHRGVDMPQPVGSPVYAMQDGIVRIAGRSPAYSDLLVQIRHRSDPPYLYSNVLHMQSLLVAEGDLVTVGDLIGYSGASESGFGHMHFEFREGCLYQECNRNPWHYLPYIDQVPGMPTLQGATLTTDETLLLLDVSIPADQLDFDGIQLTWGNPLTTSLELINATTNRDFPQGLDHPVVDLGDGAAVCILPARFNAKSRAAVYSFAYRGLAPVALGSATALDLHGSGIPANLTPTASEVVITQPTQAKVVEIGKTVSFDHQIQNQGSMTVEFTLHAHSAQNNLLVLSHDHLLLAPGATMTVSILATLSQTAPAPIGDCLVLELKGDSGQSLIAINTITTRATPKK